MSKKKKKKKGGVRNKRLTMLYVSYIVATILCKSDDDTPSEKDSAFVISYVFACNNTYYIQNV